MARRTSSLVDRWGSPLQPSSFQGFYEGGSVSRREHPFQYYNAAQDSDKLLDRYTWSQLLSGGRFLFANVPILRGGILEQANFSFPLCAHYIGGDEDWGKFVEEWVYEWQKNCNVRGPLYHMAMISRLRLIGRKVDGDIGTVLVQSNKGDFPKTQLIRAHRIGDRYGFNGEIKKGRFKGKRSKNGVVYDEWQRPFGYVILGEKEEDDQHISANDMYLLYRPTLGDESRAPSELCACIKSFADIKRLREYEMRAQQLAAAVALIEKNDTGYADEAGEAVQDESGGTDTAGTPTGLVTEAYEDGLIKYYRAKSGSGLEAFRSDRPSADAQSWEDKIVSQAFYGIEWDPDFAMCIKAPGGAWVRAKGQKIIRAIANNVAVESWAQSVDIGFAIAQAIRDGVLPAPKKDPNIYAWDISLGIPLPTVDSGNDEQAKREAYKLGLITFQALTAASGAWWRDVRKQRKVETISLASDAKELQTLFPEMDLKEWMFWLEQRAPNPPADVKEPEPIKEAA
jgi:hypothetical protein